MLVRTGVDQMTQGCSTIRVLKLSFPATRLITFLAWNKTPLICNAAFPTVLQRAV